MNQALFGPFLQTGDSFVNVKKAYIHRDVHDHITELFKHTGRPRVLGLKHIENICSFVVSCKKIVAIFLINSEVFC